jgi:hypothetical protein
LYKDEVIHLHLFLLYISRFLEDNGASRAYFKDYACLNISPNHIYKTKAEHRCAVLTLSKCISAALAGHGIAPEGIPRRLEKFATRCRKEIPLGRHDKSGKSLRGDCKGISLFLGFFYEV